MNERVEVNGGAILTGAKNLSQCYFVRYKAILIEKLATDHTIRGMALNMF
jgi:hypothetical protein